MPPIRTAKKGSNQNAKAGALSAFGFARIDRDEALSRAAKVIPAPPPAPPTPASAPAFEAPVTTEAIQAPEPPPEPAPTVTAHIFVNAFKALTGKSPPKGHKEAEFWNNQEWEADLSRPGKIGTQTKKLCIGSGFVLANPEIEQRIAMAPGVCRGLTHFMFRYMDVSYDAKKAASDLTDDAVVRLAQMCPSLKDFRLQGTSRLSDRCLIAFFENCPKLTYLEISGHSSGGQGTAFTELRESPDWAPGLKTLCLAQHYSERKREPESMKSLRALLERGRSC